MIYTIGSSGLTLPDLQRVIDAQHAVLVDIRLHAASCPPAFAPRNLHAHFGACYVHCPALGNVNDNGGPITLQDYAAGLDQIRALLRTTPAVVLMCGCGYVETCHRKVAGEQLSHALHVPLLHLTRAGAMGERPSIMAP